MLFNSYIFVFLFFPICLTGFYLFKGLYDGRVAKIFLTLMSLWFYGYFNKSYLLIMLCSIVLNYAAFSCMRLINQRRMAVAPSIVLVVAIIANLGVLFYFKYFDFFLDNLNKAFGCEFVLRGILLPLGISFFTFQQISFLVDSYRGELKECSFIDYSLYVSFFPQLIAGPIVNHEEMLPQFKTISKRQFSSEVFYKGFVLFTLGMAKKVLIADTFGAAADYGFSNIAGLYRIEAVLTMLFYTLQLYFDFSGYCDMARGLAKMLMLELPVNFNSPYKAGSITEFWKRWHITLSRFFTKYVYIPLGGNRKGEVRMYFNLFVVFFLSGLWHGAGWNFILWGCLHGILYLFTRYYERSGKRKAKRFVCVLLTFIFVNAAWVFFRAQNASDALKLFYMMFDGYRGFNIHGDFAVAFCLDEIWYPMKVLGIDALSMGYCVPMFLWTILSIPCVFFAPNADEIAAKGNTKWWFILGIAVIFVWSVLTLGRVSTFLYFNF